MRCWSVTILHPNFHPTLGHGNMIEQEARDNQGLIDRLTAEHKAQSIVAYEYEADDFSDEIRIWCRRVGTQGRRTLINLQFEGDF